MYIASTMCLFHPYNVWILLKTVITYLHWSICRTIQTDVISRLQAWARLQGACACISHQQYVVVSHFFYNIWLIRLKTIIKYLQTICKQYRSRYGYNGNTYVHHIGSCVHAQVHMFIYRSYRPIYKFHGHLIQSHNKPVVAEWWEQWTCNLEAVRGVAGSNPTVDKTFL